MEFCEKLKAARKSKGLSQAKVGELLNSAQTQIMKYENGKQEPTATRLRELCELYEISADWLLGLEKPAAKEPTSD